MKNLTKSVLKFGFIIWLLSLIAFLTETIAFRTENDLFYTSLQNAIFFATIGIGSIAFLTFTFGALISLSHRFKLLAFLRRFVTKTNFITSFLFCILAVVIFLTIKTAPNRRPEVVQDTQKVCSRTSPYPMPSEFQRALSLIEQRETASNIANHSNAVTWIKNCLDIRYGDTGNNEGEFFFDDSVSSPDRLVIVVNPSYQASDDLLTAILLRHELEHAGAYETYKKYGTQLTCLQNETSAFFWQFQFVLTLNKEELSSLDSRIAVGANQNNMLPMLKQLSAYNLQATTACQEAASDKKWACYVAEFNQQIEQSIRNNPVYQKECNL